MVLPPRPPKPREVGSGGTASARASILKDEIPGGLRHAKRQNEQAQDVTPGRNKLGGNRRPTKRKCEQVDRKNIEAAVPAYGQDKLGEFAQIASEELLALGWTDMCHQHRGRPNLAPCVQNLPHPAAHLLHRLRVSGAPITLKSAPWSLPRRDEAIQRGPHQSANSHTEFLREEMADLIRQGYWITLPYSSVRQLPNLRISPMGIVPQRKRRPRIIVDYTFSGVNDDTVPVAPTEAMQFGRTFHRILQRIANADPRHRPVHMAKVDIADGFYRVGLRAQDIQALGVAIPTPPGTDPLVAFPLTLPMGWRNSPPYFCAITETVVDLTNQEVPARPRLTPHRGHPSIAGSAVTRRPFDNSFA